MPVFVENDCNACAFGVYVTELASKPKHMVGIFPAPASEPASFSTANSSAASTAPPVRSVTWSSKSAVSKCGCGNKGCFEALASRSAIFRRIQSAVKDGQKTMLVDMLGDGLSDLRSGDLPQSLAQGRQARRKGHRGSRRIHRHRRR